MADTEMFALGPDNQPIAANRVTDTIAGGYTQIPQKYYHPNPSRNALGMVGGNDVSIASGNLVDVESDLRGTTRDLSNAPSKKYQRPPSGDALQSVSEAQPYCPLGSNEPLHGTGRNAATMLSSIQGACPSPKQLVFTERATGKVRVIVTEERHLPTKQYVSYPGVPAPEPLQQDVYGWPWRF